MPRSLTAVLLALSVATGLHAQGGIASAPAKFLVAPAQVVAIRAGRLFDSRTGTIANNQIVLIRGDRISDVGPSLTIPADARVIDLTTATVMPGMIDAHVHVYPQDDLSMQMRTIVAVANAQADLEAGFTTVLDMDSRGGYGTVDLRNAINRGVEAMRGGDLAAARRELVAGLTLVPDDPDGVYNLALLDYRDGQSDRALAGFERVLALERGNPEAAEQVLSLIRDVVAVRVAQARQAGRVHHVDGVAVLGVHHGEAAVLAGGQHRPQERLVVGLHDALVGHEDLEARDPLLRDHPRDLRADGVG